MQLKPPVGNITINKWNIHNDIFDDFSSCPSYELPLEIEAGVRNPFFDASEPTSLVPIMYPMSITFVVCCSLFNRYMFWKFFHCIVWFVSQLFSFIEMLPHFTVISVKNVYISLA